MTNLKTIGTYPNLCTIIFKTNDIMNFEPEMILAQGGTFLMGSPESEDGRWDDERQHEVTLSDYYIGKYPVTQAQWVAVMGNNPSHFKGDDLPVESVSWNECQEFIQKLNDLTGKAYRLPTEAEWEFAARGGTQSKGYLYAGSDDLNEVAWYNCDQTHPVGTKKSNELGIHDKSGNVWEWCSDWYGDYPTETQVNPTGPDSGGYRVIRGGSWLNSAQHCRSALRYDREPTYRDNYVGFRIASQ